MSGRKMWKRDMLFALLVLSLALLSLMLFRARADGKYVRITVDGREWGTYPLSEERIVDIEGRNTVCIEDGKVWMEDALCPDRLCVRMGRIWRAGETVVCLPGKVVLTVVGKESEVDLIL